MSHDRDRSRSRDKRDDNANRDHTSSLLIRNLSYRVRVEELRELFGKYGRVNDIYVPVDYVTRKPRGFAFVEFADNEEAHKAKEGCDGKELEGRALEVVFAKERRKTSDQMRTFTGGYRGDQGGRGNERRGRSSSRRRKSRSSSRSSSSSSSSSSASSRGSRRRDRGSDDDKPRRRRQEENSKPAKRNDDDDNGRRSRKRSESSSSSSSGSSSASSKRSDDKRRSKNEGDW